MASIYDQDGDIRSVDPEKWLEFDGPRFLGLHQNENVWLQEFSRIQLPATVPVEVRKMFETSRGAMIYSWFYYPLATLGMEHCYRTLELAVRIRAGPRSAKSKFSGNLKTLRDKGLISEENMISWNATRELRNIACHPSGNMLADPGEALRQLRLTATRISELFPVNQATNGR